MKVQTTLTLYLACRVGARSLWTKIIDRVSDLKHVEYDSSKVTHGTVDKNCNPVYHDPESVLSGNGRDGDDGIPYEFFVYKFGGIIVAAGRSNVYHASNAISKNGSKRCEAEPNKWAIAISYYIPFVGYTSAKGSFEMNVDGGWIVVATSDCSSTQRPHNEGSSNSSNDCSICYHVC